MKVKYIFFVLVLLASCKTATDSVEVETSNQSMKTNTSKKTKRDFAMVIHGGAGTILKKNMTPEKEKAYLDALNKALDIGEAILKDGGTSMDAVIETIQFLEDVPLFNAGKGAVFANNGMNLLDASIMNGADRNAGAVAGISNVKHPILAAKAVMEKSDHVMLAGKGAEAFCQEQGLEIVDNDYFNTDARYKSLLKAKEKSKAMGATTAINPDYKYGTVGAVALDKFGNIVAGTSTGGMTNKKYDRIGDSPVIGAGTFADNNTCGVSCTGHGEYFIRYAVAYDVSAMMEYKGVSLESAANEIINSKLVDAKGSGGLIALDKYGNVSMPFNTAGMYRGYVSDGGREVGIYR